MRRALLLLPALLLPGCGGGADGGDAKAEFVTQAEAVCATAKAERAKNPQPSEIAKLPAYVAKVVEIAETAQRDLAALTLPEDDAAELKAKLLEPLAKDVDAGKAFRAEVDAAGGDGAKLLGALGRRPKPTVDLDYARSYGLPTCAEAAKG